MWSCEDTRQGIDAVTRIDGSASGCGLSRCRVQGQGERGTFAGEEVGRIRICARSRNDALHRMDFAKREADALLDASP